MLGLPDRGVSLAERAAAPKQLAGCREHTRAGAKRGANNRGHRAGSGHAERQSSVVKCPPGLIQLRLAIRMIRLTSERPVVRSHLRPLICACEGGYCVVAFEYVVALGGAG